MVRYEISCDSCGKSIPFDKNKYEEHIRKYHSKKVNVKQMCFNAHIWRFVDEVE